VAVREWLRRHRTGALVAITIALGVCLPIPGFLAAALFWPAGIHDLESTGESVAFLAVVFLGSAVVWLAIVNALLPRRT
jgi:hypothetical protein